MSFYAIKNKRKRDATIEDYLAIKKRLIDRMENERMGDLDQKRELEKAFEPIVASNMKMTATIAEDLAPIARELENLNKSLQQP